MSFGDLIINIKEIATPFSGFQEAIKSGPVTLHKFEDGVESKTAYADNNANINMVFLPRPDILLPLDPEFSLELDPELSLLLHTEPELLHTGPELLDKFSIDKMPAINFDDICNGHSWLGSFKQLLHTDWWVSQSTNAMLSEAVYFFVKNGQVPVLPMAYNTGSIQGRYSEGRITYPRYSPKLKLVFYDIAHVPIAPLAIWAIHTEQLECLGNPLIYDPIASCSNDIENFLRPIVNDMGNLMCDYNSFTVTQLGFMIAALVVVFICLITFCCLNHQKRKLYKEYKSNKHGVRPRTRYNVIENDKYGRKTRVVLLGAAKENENDVIYQPAITEDDVSMKSTVPQNRRHKNSNGVEKNVNTKRKRRSQNRMRTPVVAEGQKQDSSKSNGKTKKRRASTSSESTSSESTGSNSTHLVEVSDSHQSHL